MVSVIPGDGKPSSGFFYVTGGGGKNSVRRVITFASSTVVLTRDTTELDSPALEGWRNCVLSQMKAVMEQS